MTRNRNREVSNEERRNCHFAEAHAPVEVALKNGGKHCLARRIVALMPKHLHYVEPFAGGLAVLLAKDPEGVSEVVNDLNGALCNFWTVLQGRWFDDFCRIVQAVLFSEVEYRHACHPDAFYGHTEAGVNQAVAFFIRCRQSYAGRMGSFAPLTRRRTRRGMNEQAAAWLTTVEGLPEVHARLKRVVILNRPALEVITGQDGPDTLFYCDPPYLHATRASPDVYAHEMTEDEHRQLLEVLNGCKGKVMLSGYPSELYDRELAGWTRHAFDLPNNAAGGKKKGRETEVLWCNF